MNNYIPFLKVKANEMGALSTMAADLKAITYPFLDLPKKEFEDVDAFLATLAKARKSVGKHTKGFPSFFLDDYDLDDRLEIAGECLYGAIIDQFSDLPQFVPVLGLDRKVGRNEVVFQRRRVGTLTSRSVAVRLQPEDFENFDLVADDLIDLQNQGRGLFEHWAIILDNRLCLNLDVGERAGKISRFVAAAATRLNVAAFIIVGSSISASIRDILGVEAEEHHPRAEIQIYRAAAPALKNYNIFLGDYTVVSPFYSDIEIPKEAMQNVTAPKVIYSYDDNHFIVRGGALKTHVRGFLQYNDIAANIIRQAFYRTPGYSFGDGFIFEKAQGIGSMVTPASIIKPTINLHMTYMLKGFAG